MNYHNLVTTFFELLFLMTPISFLGRFVLRIGKQSNVLIGKARYFKGANDTTTVAVGTAVTGI